MTVGVTTQTKGTEQASAASVSSRRVLAEPTDVSVGAPVLGTEKAGQDLVVRLANGETQTIENFFVIGPDGDFSRLLSASGTPVVTGLMAPEPDIPQDSEFTQGMQAPIQRLPKMTVRAPQVTGTTPHCSQAPAFRWAAALVFCRVMTATQPLPARRKAPSLKRKQIWSKSLTH